MFFPCHKKKKKKVEDISCISITIIYPLFVRNWKTDWIPYNPGDRTWEEISLELQTALTEPGSSNSRLVCYSRMRFCHFLLYRNSEQYVPRSGFSDPCRSDENEDHPSPLDSYLHYTEALLCNSHPSVKNDTFISTSGPARGQESVMVGRPLRGQRKQTE